MRQLVQNLLSWTKASPCTTAGVEGGGLSEKYRHGQGRSLSQKQGLAPTFLQDSLPSACSDRRTGQHPVPLPSPLLSEATDNGKSSHAVTT